MTPQEAVEALQSRQDKLYYLSTEIKQPKHIMRGIEAEFHAQSIAIALLSGQTAVKPDEFTLEDALHYLGRRRVHLATKVLGNTDVPYTSRVKCGLEREAILLAESAVKAEIDRDMVCSMRDVV